MLAALQINQESGKPDMVEPCFGSYAAQYWNWPTFEDLKAQACNASGRGKARCAEDRMTAFLDNRWQ